MNQIHAFYPSHQSQYARQRSLSKMYKDLVITKRDLVDLRQSIQQTIHSIKQSDRQLQLIQQRRRITSLASAIPIRSYPQKAHPQPLKRPIIRFSHADSQSKFKCPHCNFKSENMSDLDRHQQQNHQTCNKCHQIISLELKDHVEHTCGQERFACYQCNLMIRKKDLDEHIRICFFRQCFKCKKQVYALTLPYHLQTCGKKGLASRRADKVSAQAIQLKKENIPFIIPCCMVWTKEGKRQ